MSLLRRIATSKGSKARQVEATKLLSLLNQKEIEAWHEGLEEEVQKKRAQAQGSKRLENLVKRDSKDQ